MNPPEKYRQLLKQIEVDGLLLMGRINRRYAAGFDIAEGIMLMTRDQCFFLTDSRYLEEAEKHLPGFCVRLVNRNATYLQQIKELIETLPVRTLAYEEQCMTAGEFIRWSGELSVRLLPVQKEIDALRMEKTEQELLAIENAQRITDRSFQDILNIIRPGITEAQLRRELICILYRNGGEDLAFDPIVVSGPNTSLPHGVAGERMLQDGDFVTLDFGCKWNGYCSDMTRTVAIDHVTDEMQHVYNLVLQAQEAGIDATNAGVSGAQVDEAARCVIDKAGYGNFFGHGYGHGIGLEIHEAPNCSPSWQLPLPAGSVCSAEPGIYLPGKFGVRIEDMVVVEEMGCRNLTHSPKSLIIL